MHQISMTLFKTRSKSSIILVPIEFKAIKNLSLEFGHYNLLSKMQVLL